MAHPFSLCCLLFLAVTPQPAAAQAEERAAAFAMTTSEFRRLTPADQKALLASAFERRLEHARNISYQALQTGANHEYTGGEVGKLAVKFNGNRYRHWRLGDAYRMDTIRGGDLSVKPYPVRTVASNFDPETGVYTGTTHFSNTERCYGRIDTVPDSINDSNRYAYWLDGEDTPIQQYYIRYLVEHREDFAIDTSGDGDLIHLTVPWTPFWSREVLGKRTYELDPLQGFLPVRGEARWQLTRPDGELDWREEQFFVEDSKLVGDVYMPTTYKELIRASTLGDHLVGVYLIEVSEIEAGNVTPKDLEVPLTEGMEVVDAIQGIFYKVGPDGKPFGKVEQLVP